MARYNLDEMAIMAKERRIDVDNLQDVMESLAHYDMSNEAVRYILEELVASENMPKEYKKWIDGVLDNYDKIQELIEEDIIEPTALDNIDVKEAIIDEAPRIEPSIEPSTKSEESDSNASDVNETNDNTKEESMLEDVVEGALVAGAVAEIVDDVVSTVVEPIIDVPVEVEEKSISQMAPKVENAPAPTANQTLEVPLVDVTEQIQQEAEKFNGELGQQQVTEELMETEAVPYIINESAQVFGATSIYQENELKMEEVKKLALVKGINIISSKANPQEPVEISMELTPESKPYLDNLLLQLYGDNKNNLKMDLVKDSETGKEMLVMEVNDKDLSFTEVQKYGQEMLTSITEIIETTDKNKDYEALMSPELRELRDKFHADEPDIINDTNVEIVTSKEDGQSLYHIVTPSKEGTKVVAEELGVTIKEDHGGGIFEIDDRNIPDMVNTKIAIGSKDVNYTDEVKEVKENEGLSDLDINYNNEHFYSDTKESGPAEIMDFLRESNEDERTISRITVETYGDQRVVKMCDTNGFNDTVVINEGEGFDRFVLPAIAGSFAKDTDVSGSKTYEESGTVGYFGENSKNTQLVINGYDEKTMDKVESQVESSKAQTNEMTNTNSKAYGKVLGVYPTKVSNSKESANTSFLTLLVFILILVLGVMIVYVIYGG